MKAQAKMRIGVGVTDKEPVIRRAVAECPLAELRNRPPQEVVFQRARALELGEQPVAAGGANPVTG